MAPKPKRPKIKSIPGQESFKGNLGKVRSTEQDIKIAEGLAAGKTKKQALMEAGISETNAESNAKQIINSPGVQAALNKAFKKAGIGLDRIAGVLSEGLNAEKPVVVKSRIVFVKDHAVRHQVARTVCELENLFPDPKMKLEHSGSIGITNEADKELIEWLQSATKK